MAPVPHLLIVDDDKEICALLSKFLAQHGYRVSVARDGRAMMQALENARISLVVLDLMLPGEDGLSLCRRVRADSTMPIVMLTAVSEDTDRIVGLEMGADDYLAKPFHPRELLSRVRAVLRRVGPPWAVRWPAPAGCWNLPAGASTSPAASCSRRPARWCRCGPPARRLRGFHRLRRRWLRATAVRPFAGVV